MSTDCMNMQDALPISAFEKEMTTRAKEAGNSLALSQDESNAAGSAGYLRLIMGSDGQLYMSLINKKWGNE